MLEPFQTAPVAAAAAAAPAAAPAPEPAAPPEAAEPEPPPQEALSALAQFLVANGLGEYGSVLAAQGAAEPQDLDGMTPEDLVEYGIKVLHVSDLSRFLLQFTPLLLYFTRFPVTYQARKIIRLVGAL